MSLDNLNNLHTKVQSGEVSGMVTWPLSGEAHVSKIDSTYKQGVEYISIVLKHAAKGNREFLVRVPQSTDKSAAVFMGMQRIYGTIYAVAGVSPADVDPGTAFKQAQAIAANEGPLVNFELEEYESNNSRNGQTYVNQSLKSLVRSENEWA